MSNRKRNTERKDKHVLEVVKPVVKDFIFVPFNQQQRSAAAAFKVNDILFLLGEAGSGKTHVAVSLAMEAVLSGQASKIILTRPTVPSGGEQLGFLPGKLEAKMHPWLLPIHDVLKKITFQNPAEWFKEHVEVVPLAFMRGRTFDRCVAILDEAQNCSYEQLKLFLTRIGNKGKLIISGDLHQSDREDSGLDDIVWYLQDPSAPPGVSLHNLTSLVNPRHPIISEIISRLS